jgi:hypothetical protein
MMFELLQMTKAKLIEVFVLSQKNRQPDENPGAKLTVEIAVPNHALSMFDGFLKGFLFTKHGAESPKAKQTTLDGVEVVSDLPNLSGIAAHVGVLPWSHEMTGYGLVVDLGLGGKRSNLVIDDCVLSGWKITPKEGGSVLVKFNIESANVSESAFGKLAKMKSREIQFTLTPPEIQQEDLDGDDKAPPASAAEKPIDGSVAAFKRDHPEAQTDGAGAPTGADPGGKEWPFPKKDAAGAADASAKAKPIKRSSSDAEKADAATAAFTKTSPAG